MPRPIAAAQQTWWQNHTLCLMTTGNTTQGSVFRPIITPFWSSRPSKNSEADEHKRQEAATQRGSRAINPNQPHHSPLSRPQCAFCCCSTQPQSRPVYDNVPGGHHFPAPGMTGSVRAESLTTAAIHRETPARGAAAQCDTAPHHSACFHCHSVQLQSLHMFLLKFPCFFS